MKRLAISLTALAMAAFGASWDGTQGDITLTTTSLVSRAPASLQLPLPMQTKFTVKCSNPNVSAVRLTFAYRGADGTFTGTFSQVVDLGPLHTAQVLTAVAADAITTPPTVTELSDGTTTAF